MSFTYQNTEKAHVKREGNFHARMAWRCMAVNVTIQYVSQFIGRIIKKIDCFWLMLFLGIELTAWLRSCSVDFQCGLLPLSPSRTTPNLKVRQTRNLRTSRSLTRASCVLPTFTLEFFRGEGRETINARLFWTHYKLAWKVTPANLKSAGVLAQSFNHALNQNYYHTTTIQNNKKLVPSTRKMFQSIQDWFCLCFWLKIFHFHFWCWIKKQHVSFD